MDLILLSHQIWTSGISSCGSAPWTYSRWQGPKQQCLKLPSNWKILWWTAHRQCLLLPYAASSPYSSRIRHQRRCWQGLKLQRRTRGGTWATCLPQKTIIWWFMGSASLPEGLHKFPSLTELSISHCPQIQSLPKNGLPTSLETFSVFICSSALEEEIKRFTKRKKDTTRIDD